MLFVKIPEVMMGIGIGFDKGTNLAAYIALSCQLEDIGYTEDKCSSSQAQDENNTEGGRSSVAIKRGCCSSGLERRGRRWEDGGRAGGR